MPHYTPNTPLEGGASFLGAIVERHVVEVKPGHDGHEYRLESWVKLAHCSEVDTDKGEATIINFAPAKPKPGDDLGDIPMRVLGKFRVRLGDGDKAVIDPPLAGTTPWDHDCPAPELATTCGACTIVAKARKLGAEKPSPTPATPPALIETGHEWRERKRAEKATLDAAAVGMITLGEEELSPSKHERVDPAGVDLSALENRVTVPGELRTLGEIVAPKDGLPVTVDVPGVTHTDISTPEDVAANRMRVAVEVNCCEHGDHPAPEGKRFCSEACADCDSTPQPSDDRCANVCGRAGDP